MASYNRVILMGNLTRDPEVRYTPSGKAVGEIGLAISRSYRGTDNQQHDEVCYVSVVVWGRQAETCGEYLKKGAPVFVEGRLQYDQWEKDGQKFNRLRVVASRVQFLGGGKRRGEDRDGRSATPVEEPGQASMSEPASESAAEPASEGEMGDDDNLPF